MTNYIIVFTEGMKEERDVESWINDVIAEHFPGFVGNMDTQIQKIPIRLNHVSEAQRSQSLKRQG